MDTIKKYLDKRAEEDELFAKTYKKENKNLDDCVTYIFNTVKETGREGFADEEIYSMAVHYYDEDDIKNIDKAMDMKVIVNHEVQLTEEEKKEARKQAMDQLIREQKSKMSKAGTKKTTPTVTPNKSEDKGEFAQGELF